MGKQFEEVKASYYEYVIKIEKGSQEIARLLREESFEIAFVNIANFAEGLEWLTNVESILLKQNYIINSRIVEAVDIMNEINNAIKNRDFTLVADLFEYEIHSIFDSASEWIFVKK